MGAVLQVSLLVQGRAAVRPRSCLRPAHPVTARRLTPQQRLRRTSLPEGQGGRDDLALGGWFRRGRGGSLRSAAPRTLPGTPGGRQAKRKRAGGSLAAPREPGHHRRADRPEGPPALAPALRGRRRRRFGRPKCRPRFRHVSNPKRSQRRRPPRSAPPPAVPRTPADGSPARSTRAAARPPVAGSSSRTRRTAASRGCPSASRRRSCRRSSPAWTTPTYPTAAVRHPEHVPTEPTEQLHDDDHQEHDQPTDSRATHPCITTRWSRPTTTTRPTTAHLLHSARPQVSDHRSTQVSADTDQGTAAPAGVGRSSCIHKVTRFSGPQRHRPSSPFRAAGAEQVSG